MHDTDDGRPRARALGIAPPGEPGPLNAISDVAGVEVGVITLIEGDGHRSPRLPHDRLVALLGLT